MYFATSDEMSTLDELAVENGLEIRQMMELAGYHILGLFEILKIKPEKKVTVLVGKGNKGGDGICAARHLSNNGYEVELILLSTDLSDNSQHQLKLIQKMGVTNQYFENISDQKIFSQTDIIIDALIGYRLRGAPRNSYGDVIRIANESDSMRISYDIPTGIEASSGECTQPCFKADATLTLGLPKLAFKNDEAKQYIGKLFWGDIGIPSFMYDEIQQGIGPDFKSATNGLIKIY